MVFEDQDASVTMYLSSFKSGCMDSKNELIERYWPRVIAAAAAQLRSGGIRIADEDDVAVSVFDYLCREADQGRFGKDKLNDRDDLWRHLSTLIKHKAIDIARKERAAKRGAGNVTNQSALEGDESQQHVSFEGFAATPVEQAIEIEEQTQFLSLLQTDEIREIVLLRLEGYQQNEIAEKMGLSERTIRRKLDLAKQTWQENAVA